MDLNKISIGDIFSYSWGYEQTNIEFYQVIAKTRTCIKIQQVKQVKKENELLMQGNIMPVKDCFVEGSKPLLKRPYEWSTHICVRMEFGSCWIWDGKPEDYSSYA